MQRRGRGDAAKRLEVWLAITETGLVTDVMAGENMFRRLSHTGVVRHLERMATVAQNEVDAETPITQARPHRGCLEPVALARDRLPAGREHVGHHRRRRRGDSLDAGFSQTGLTAPVPLAVTRGGPMPRSVPAGAHPCAP